MHGLFDALRDSNARAMLQTCERMCSAETARAYLVLSIQRRRVIKTSKPDDGIMHHVEIAAPQPSHLLSTENFRKASSDGIRGSLERSHLF